MTGNEFDFTVRLPKRFGIRYLMCCPVGTGAEVDEIMGDARTRGYLTLPWNTHRIVVHATPSPGSRVKASLALDGAWWAYCDRERLPYVAVEVRADGRALIRYGIACFGTLVCNYYDLSQNLDRIYDSYPRERERPLKATPWHGAFHVGDTLGRVAFHTEDTRPLSCTLNALRNLISRDELQRIEDEHRERPSGAERGANGHDA